jgi:ABC-type antimicrobial peptide transport system permease subunit
MRSLTRNNLRNARKMIRAHRGRSYMTMLGIMIGIASVVTVAGVGEGIKRQVSGQIHHAGETLLTVRPGVDQGNHTSLRSLIAPKATSNLSEKDIAAVRKADHITLAAPLALVSGELKGSHGSYTAGPVVGVGNDLPQLMNQSVAYGAFFTEDDIGQNVAVLGENAAVAMFDRQVPLGDTFTFRGKEFMVRGIFNTFAAAPLSADISFNDAIFIPYSTARGLTNNTVLPYEILAKADNKTTVNDAQNAITTAIRKNHGNIQDFSVLKASENLAATNSVLSLLTKLTVIAAGISLFVGGIGIMNITLVSVTERLHEIGIRKAVGATNRQILGEFVAEAVVLTVSGAIMGIIASLAINLLLRIFTDLTPVVQWQVIVIATAISVCIGILFGTAPALKAARKDPIAALRGDWY